MSNETKDEAKQDKQGKVKGLLGLIRKSAEQTADACGPGCGCHTEYESTEKEPEPDKGS
jgi:hypothetical protein